MRKRSSGYREQHSHEMQPGPERKKSQSRDAEGSFREASDGHLMDKKPPQRLRAVVFCWSGVVPGFPPFRSQLDSLLPYLMPRSIMTLAYRRAVACFL
jgi:hypothetical protein